MSAQRSESTAALKDPYAYDATAVEAPPSTFRDAIKRIGPGMILAASIVGSGELIATTSLGAEVGMTCLWLIIISCLIKPALQAEMGRFTIATGKTGLGGFNLMPGPKGGVSWVVWLWVAMILMTLFQIGAMFAGVGQVLHTIFPAVAIDIWVIALYAFSLWLLLGGGYSRVEGIASVKVGLFTFITVLSAAILLKRPGSLTAADFANGLSFHLPSTGMKTAVAVFGITGVGAAELFMYPYWCIEKGYAQSTGENDFTPAWRDRARGWVRVMHLDIIASMIIYTFATAAFYLLGAGVLHPQGLIPKSKEMIATLSHMYTDTLGPWALWVFYVGAIATLYGTIFAATASNSRVFADVTTLLGVFKADDYAQRIKWRNRFVVVLLTIPTALHFLRIDPTQMVKMGGIAQAAMLPIIAVSVMTLRQKNLPKELKSTGITAVTLWVASIVTIVMMLFYVVKLITG